MPWGLTIPLFFVLLMALPALGGVVTYFFLRRSASGYMVCTKCNYPGTTLTSFRCSECGSDVRLTGLSPVGSKLRRVAVIAVTLWLIIYYLGVMWKMPTLIGMLPTIQSQTMTSTLSGGRTGAYTDVDVTATIDVKKGWPWQSTQVTLFDWVA